jgi:hypothetical protein
MSDTATASAPDALDDERGADTETDESIFETTAGLDDEALDAVGVDLAMAILAGAVGVAAWDLPSGWLVLGSFAIGGVGIMFAEDLRVRSVGALVFAGVLAPLVAHTAFVIMLAGAVATAISAVYHHDLVDVSAVI